MTPRSDPTTVVGVRLTEHDHTRLLRAAREAGQPLSAWIRSASIMSVGGVVTGPWWCDCCGEPIDSPEKGWVQWRVSNSDTPTCDLLEVVHHSGFSPRGADGCYPHAFDPIGMGWAGDHLEQFLGAAGIARLLWIASDNPPLDLLVEVMQRLHVPDRKSVV